MEIKEGKRANTDKVITNQCDALSQGRCHSKASAQYSHTEDNIPLDDIGALLNSHDYSGSIQSECVGNSEVVKPKYAL